jgi:hypothetical protein
VWLTNLQDQSLFADSRYGTGFIGQGIMVIPHLGFGGTSDPVLRREEVTEPVTNQVTTAPGGDRHSATYPDTYIPLARGNQI